MAEPSTEDLEMEKLKLEILHLQTEIQKGKKSDWFKPTSVVPFLAFVVSFTGLLFQVSERAKYESALADASQMLKQQIEQNNLTMAAIAPITASPNSAALVSRGLGANSQPLQFYSDELDNLALENHEFAAVTADYDQSNLQRTYYEYKAAQFFCLEKGHQRAHTFTSVELDSKTRTWQYSQKGEKSLKSSTSRFTQVVCEA